MITKTSKSALSTLPQVQTRVSSVRNLLFPFHIFYFISLVYLRQVLGVTICGIQVYRRPSFCWQITPPKCHYAPSYLPIVYDEALMATIDMIKSARHFRLFHRDPRPIAAASAASQANYLPRQSPSARAMRCHVS